ncbi:MAG: hypothetical protein IJ763_10955 [Lachnospiraceae bacterium]|nr:hypothetical protein [Lachnospiraceae bacterium]MBR1817197.1 hypothetical protein [Lachnospiraceae bacterium]
MARRKDTIVLFKPYESRSPNGNEKGYVRITPSLFHSDAVRDINYASFKIYLDMRFVAERLGHESVTVTERYSHLYPSVQRDMAKSLNNAFVDIEEDSDNE